MTSSLSGERRHAHNFVFGLIVLIALAVRVPHLTKELAPYQFCDEGMWLSEVQRMLSTGSLVPSNFRSGSLSIVPVFLASRVASIFVGRPLTGNQITVIARFVLILGSTTGCAFVFRRLCRRLLHSETMVSICVATLLLNPASLAFSIYWYPDHFIMFPAVVFYLVILKAHDDEGFSHRSFGIAGAALAILLSVKYTTLLAGVMLLIPLFKGVRPRFKMENLRPVFWRLFALAMGTTLMFLVMNYGMIVRPDRFLTDFKFNFENYGQVQGGMTSFLFYSWSTFVSPLGLLAVGAFLWGIRVMIRLSGRLTVSLLSFPVLLILSLSRSGLTVSRHSAVVIPLVVLIFTVGLENLVSLLVPRIGKSGLSVAMVTVPMLIAPVVESGRQVSASLRQDSRVAAAEWIRANIPATSTIGSNEFCSGASPADTVGLKTTIDPTLSLHLEYYVLNSYWASPLFPHYLDRGNQRYFHFYRINGFGVPLFVNPTSLSDLVPPGYVIAKTITLDGPEIVVLKRIST